MAKDEGAKEKLQAENASSQALAKVATKAGLPKDFPRMSATAKLHAILDLEEPHKVIRLLRPDELFHLIREIGLEDGYQLALLGTPEQRDAIRDLLLFGRHGQYLPRRMDDILTLSMESGLEEALEVIRRSDGELLALHLFSQARFVLARDEEAEDLPDIGTFLTPDNVFMVYCPNPDNVPSVKRFLDLLYAEGVEFAQRIIFAGLHDTPMSLEEQSLRYRNFRLQDLGFPPPEERFSIFEPLEEGPFVDLLKRHAKIPDWSSEPPTPSLAIVLANKAEDALFWECLLAIDDERTLRRILHRMLYLVNHVASAITDDYEDDEAWQEAATYAVATVSLGIEALSSGTSGVERDVEIGREVLASVHPKYLFRIGFGRVHRLVLMARRIGRDIGGLSALDILGPRRSQTVRGLLEFPPMFSVLGVGHFEFSTLNQVREVQRLLSDTMGVLEFLKDHLDFMPVTARRHKGLVEPTLLNAIATLWARTVLYGEPSLEPLTADEVTALRAVAFEGGRIRNALKDASSVLKGKVPQSEAVQAFLDEALEAVEEALSGLDPSRKVDVRFIGTALLVKGD